MELATAIKAPNNRGPGVLACISVLVFQYARSTSVGVNLLFSARRLGQLRKAKGLTQEAVARRAGLATVTVSKLEEGRVADPKSSTLARIAKVLGCTVAQLMVREK